MDTHKTLVYFITVILLLFFFVPYARAAGMEVSCGPGGCTLSTSDPLFSESEIYPGWSITKSVKAKNTYPEDRHFAVSVEGATFSDSTPPLSDVLTVTITELESGTVVYGPKSITDWKADGLVTLSTIPPGGERNYDFVVELTDVGNEYQGKSLSFDLNLGFKTLPGSVLGEETEKQEGKVLAATGTSPSVLVFDLVMLGIGILLRIYSKRLRRRTTKA